jgi:hypothetical protein
MTATLTDVVGGFMCLFDPNMDEISQPKTVKFNSKEEYSEMTAAIGQKNSRNVTK